MPYPRININLDKIEYNTLRLNERCRKNDISIMGVTKVFCGEAAIAERLVYGGVKYLADSRISNLVKYRHINIPKVLLRLPMISEIEDIIKYADISLNSEAKTVYLLNEKAKEYNKIHKIILMIDLGDLREGYFGLEELYEHIDYIISMKNIQIYGIGTNLTCYGGVIPTEENLSRLINIKDDLELKYNMKIPLISGGNSSSLYLLNEEFNLGINNLRLGESVVLGRETAFGKEIEGLFNDAFQLSIELVEIKEKPSIPIGKIGMDAFGRAPKFEDKGNIIRGIGAIGKQDISIGDLTPIDENVKILGGSSDHLILDLTSTENKYEIGDKLEFNLTYGGILSLMTSQYVYKNYI